MDFMAHEYLCYYSSFIIILVSIFLKYRSGALQNEFFECFRSCEIIC